MALFEINPLDRVPIYEQLKRQIIMYISVGRLKPEDRLPSVRQLATELGINPNTVHKVYRELELSDIIRTVPARGTFVNKLPEAEERDYRIWGEECRNLISTAMAKALDSERCKNIFYKLYEEMDLNEEEK